LHGNSVSYGSVAAAVLRLSGLNNATYYCNVRFVLRIHPRDVVLRRERALQRSKFGRRVFMELRDKVAIVTGATSGIGRAVAINLHQAGMKLVLTGRRTNRLNELSETLGQAAYLVGDIVEPDVPKQLIRTAQSHFNRCDVIINNAGMIEVGEVPDIDIEKVCAMVRLNTEAAFRVIFTSCKYFLDNGGGHIINTSSVLGSRVRQPFGAYAGTKAAIEALSEALRLELAGTGVAISCIQPGLVMSEIYDDWPVHPSKARGIDPPLQPEDIARCIRFILEQPAHVRVPRLMVLPESQVT